jgi:hypothetical protein
MDSVKGESKSSNAMARTRTRTRRHKYTLIDLSHHKYITKLSHYKKNKR